jgi:hypothetical protein
MAQERKTVRSSSARPARKDAGMDVGMGDSSKQKDQQVPQPPATGGKSSFGNPPKAQDFW